MTGVRWRILVGLMSRTRILLVVARPPACSMMNAIGFTSYSSRTWISLRCVAIAKWHTFRLNPATRCFTAWARSVSVAECWCSDLDSSITRPVLQRRPCLNTDQWWGNPTQHCTNSATDDVFVDYNRFDKICFRSAIFDENGCWYNFLRNCRDFSSFR